ncbi:MAG: extracellular solute-binding protein [Treponema sp.]|nr:extracellular solute-binding protein [Treponema sp.]
MKKFLFVLLVLVMAGGMLFAVGNRQQSGQTTLRFSWWGTDARHEATLAVIEAFEKANPDIKIEAEYGAQDGYNQKKTTEFASRTAPDIFQVETGAGPEYYRMGVLYNLSSLPINLSDFAQAFLVGNGQFGSGSQYCIPTGVGGTMLTVNKALAERLGIDFTQPYDWEQLITWGQKVRAADPNVYLLSADTGRAMPFFVRAYARQLNGAAIINDANKTLNMTEAQFVQVFDFVDRLYKSGAAAPAAYIEPFGEQTQNDPNWIAGRYVAHVGYTSTSEVMQAANPSIEYIPGALPLLANRKSDGWYNDPPQYMAISANTRYPQEAARFLDFFFNSEEAARLLGTVRSVPPTAMAQRVVVSAGVLNPLHAAGVARSQTYNGQPDAGYTTAAEPKAILDNAYAEVSFGRMTPAQAAATVVQQLNAYLARQ